MNKTLKGILLGAIAGIIDVIPMVLQKLTWDANLSAFSMWVIIGFLLTKIELNIPPLLKGLVVSFLVLTPIAFIIGWENPFNLVPVFIMTIILGSLLGIATRSPRK